jgi:hypothetical protein
MRKFFLRPRRDAVWVPDFIDDFEAFVFREAKFNTSQHTAKVRSSPPSPSTAT